MRIILLGPPGAGKGTHADWISQRYRISHLSMGDMLRDIATTSSPLAHKIAALLNQGQLIDDTLATDLLKQRMAKVDCNTGFVLDGFPRTMLQAEELTTFLSIDVVIELILEDAVIIERLSGRRIHPGSGRVYHIQQHPPQIQDQDDITQEPLIQRPDDRASVINHRLAIYHQETYPVAQYYQLLASRQSESGPRYHRVDASQSIECVRQDIESILVR